MKTSITIPDDVFERIKVDAAASGVSVSALLVGLYVGEVPMVPHPSIDHGIVQTADLSMPTPQAIAYRSLKDGETQVSLIVPVALINRMPAGDKITLMEDALILRYGNGVIKRVK